MIFRTIHRYLEVNLTKKRIHRLVHDLAVDKSILNQNLEPFFKKKTILNPTQYPVIDGAGDPFDILYCAPPKCGTTSWKMGVQVLKDRRKGRDLRYNLNMLISGCYHMLHVTCRLSKTWNVRRTLKGIIKKPESYVPRDLFNKFHINPYKFSSGGNFNPLHGNITDWLKVLEVRNPWNRLYSAWKDKSRTFRFPNGTINWKKAFRKTFLIGSVVIQSQIVMMIWNRPIRNME